MFLTIQTLFDDANIVSAIIRRVNQTRKDTIYWQQYLTFRRVTTRVFKDYIGSVTGVMAGSINSRFGEKPIRERRNIGSGYGEIAYLGDAYQMSIDRLSELQDLIDKFNAAKPADQKAAMEEIVNFLADDYRQITLAAHKRMDIIVGALLMLGDGKSSVRCPLKPKRFYPLKIFNNAPSKSLDRWGYYYFSLFPSVCRHLPDTFSV